MEPRVPGDPDRFTRDAHLQLQGRHLREHWNALYEQRVGTASPASSASSDDPAARLPMKCIFHATLDFIRRPFEIFSLQDHVGSTAPSGPRHM